jgi:hypothetical protein
MTVRELQDALSKLTDAGCGDAEVLMNGIPLTVVRDVFTFTPSKVESKRWKKGKAAILDWQGLS